MVGDRGPLKVTATGVTAVRMEIEKRSEEDLTKAELLSGPLVLIILLLVFGSVVAASTPLAVGILAVIGSFVILRLLDMVVQVSVFSVNITTALGLGLAIDYSLFIVTRYREELARGRTVHEAIAQSVRTMRPHGPVLRPHRRRISLGDARLPHVPPALLRLLRHRRGDPGRPRVRHHPARPACRPRPPHRLPQRAPPLPPKRQGRRRAH